MQSALAAGAALVALGFAMATFERWLAGRRRHELAWSVSLLLFSLGAGCLLVGAANGWDEWSFRLFFLFGAILNVPFLALGTVYLLGGQRRGDVCAIGVSLTGAFAAGVLLVAPLRAGAGPPAPPRPGRVRRAAACSPPSRRAAAPSWSSAVRSGARGGSGGGPCSRPTC